jgi:hypothetical protein
MNFFTEQRLEDYQECSDAGKINELHDDVRQGVTIRNALYAAGGVSAAGLTVTIAIPRLANRNKPQTTASVE